MSDMERHIFYLHEIDEVERLEKECLKRGFSINIERVNGFLKLYNPNKYWTLKGLLNKPAPVIRQDVVKIIDESLGIEYSHSKQQDFIVCTIKKCDTI